jgi:hypothetical protein
VWKSRCSRDCGSEFALVPAPVAFLEDETGMVLGFEVAGFAFNRWEADLRRNIRAKAF